MIDKLKWAFMAFWGPILGVFFGIYLVIRVFPGFVVEELEKHRRKKHFNLYTAKLKNNITPQPEAPKVRELAKNDWSSA